MSIDNREGLNYPAEALHTAYNRAVDECIRVVAMKRPPEPTPEDEILEEIISELSKLKSDDNGNTKFSKNG